jgi:benzoyl-CoA-dihydrodiol lyase
VSPQIDGNTLRYKHVTIEIMPDKREGKITVKAPSAADRDIPEDAAQLGSDWYALAMWRELRHAILELRFNFPTVGLISFYTEGSAEHVLALDSALWERRENWFVREVLLQQARTLKMIDVTARTFFAIITPGSCFAGSLFELALASDRAYMLDDPDEDNAIAIGALNEGAFPMAHGLTRLENRFYGDEDKVRAATSNKGKLLEPAQALELGLVTDVFDDIDWDDEIRLSLEERRSLSPDALTGMEANLRFAGPETMESRIFARLSAWQNWIFTRPNAVGDRGALTSYGTPNTPEFDWSRV